MVNTNLTDTILLQHLLQSNHSVNISGELHMPTRLLLTSHGAKETLLIKEIGMRINQKQRGKSLVKPKKYINFESVFYNYNGQLLKISVADLILPFNINILCHFMVGS